jgi:putative membrane protein
MPFPVSRLAHFELRRFRGPLPKIALVFVMIIPLLYGAIYLTANWDPYGKLKNLPVALVNSDRPTTVGKETISAGADFVTDLHEKNAFKWIDVDEGEATRGLRQGDYYLAVIVPPDFSANLVSGQGDDPQRAQVMLRRNDANGFVIGNITNSAQNSIARAVDESAETSYFNAVFANLAKIRTGLVDAADGSQKLATGITDAEKGSAKLASGTGDAADGAADLSTGATSLASGLRTAKTGSADLATGLRSARTGSADLASGLRTAKTGSADLATGLRSAKTGSADLADGLGTLKKGSSSLADGAGQVADGTQQLNDQVVPVLSQVQKVLPRVESDAKTVSSRLTEISKNAAAGSGSISSDLDAADDELAQLAKDNPEIADDPAYKSLQDRVSAASGRADDIADAVDSGATQISRINKLVQRGSNLDSRVGTAKDDLIELNQGAQQVASGAKRLDRGIGSASNGADDLAKGIRSASAGADSLATGIRSASTGADSLATGIRSASTGADSLATGIRSASTGADSLATGAGDLSTGLDKLDTGASDLDTGLTKLQGGADDLHTALVKGANRIPSPTQDEQNRAVQVLSSPADVTMQVDNPATLYGRGLAPLFFSIALWVYGISVFLVVRPISSRALAGRGSAVRLALAAWLPIGAIAVAAGWLMVGAVALYPGLDPVHPVLITLLVTLAAVCFSAIAHLLRTALGTPGSSLLLVLLILQLSAAGGTYPGPLLPGFFQAISPFLPMTYLIDAFRVVISGGLMSHLVRDVLILAAVAAAALGATTLVVRRRQQFSMKDLHPPLTAP